MSMLTRVEVKAESDKCHEEPKAGDVRGKGQGQGQDSGGADGGR